MTKFENKSFSVAMTGKEHFTWCKCIMCRKKKGRAMEERINQIISDNAGVNIKEVKPDQRLIDDLGCDSLDTVELIMALEDEYEIAIPDVDSEKIKTVGEIHEYMKTRVTTSGSGPMM